MKEKKHKPDRKQKSIESIFSPKYDSCNEDEMTDLEQVKDNNSNNILHLGEDNSNIPLNQEGPLTLGYYLKKKRESQGLALQKISTKTKISLSILQDLEQDRFKKLPNQVYVKGFVKQYCKTLQVDPTESLTLLDRAYNQKIVGKNKISKQISDKSKLGVFSKLSFVLIFVILWGGYRLYQKNILIHNEQKKTSTKPIMTETITAKTPLHIQKKISETPINPLEKLNSKPILKKDILSPPPTKKENLVHKNPDSTNISEVKNNKLETIKLREIPSNMYSVSTNNNTLLIPEKLRGLPSNQKQSVFISAANGDTWLAYKNDSKPVRQFILKKGKYILITGDEIRLRLGNANATKVFLNNKLLEISTRSGVKSLVFPKSSHSKYKMPLFISNNDGSLISSDEWEKNRDMSEDELMDEEL